jgi:hypothetical protein
MLQTITIIRVFAQLKNGLAETVFLLLKNTKTKFAQTVLKTVSEYR